MIPSINDCFRLMDEYKMLDNIKAHSLVVAKVAHLISRGLCDAGYHISVETATAAALLHDIGKTASLDSGTDHAEIGRQICLSHDFHEIANIIAEHIRLKNYDLSNYFSEKEVVFYADKRVNHNQIVVLEDRFAYVVGRYVKNQDKRLYLAIKKNFELCKKVEEKLFAALTFNPGSVRHLATTEQITELAPDAWGCVTRRVRRKRSISGSKPRE